MKMLFSILCYPFLGARHRIQACIPKSRKLRTKRDVTGAWNTYCNANQLGLGWLWSMFLFTIRIWVSGFVSMDKTLGNNVTVKRKKYRNHMSYFPTHRRPIRTRGRISNMHYNPSPPYVVREMYLSLLLPSPFYFLTLFAAVPVRVLFKPSFFRTRSHVLFLLYSSS